MKQAFLTIIMVFCLLFSISYAEDAHNYKKVVSIVYDDSGSMQSYNNYCYSDYALQILTASLGHDDELNIVKVSSPGINNVVDLSTPNKKQSYIEQIRAYKHIGGTFFESVNTAKDWLISKKNLYGSNADYWFIVITDGEFANMPNDLNAYFVNLNQEFNNMNYEFILLSIGFSFDQQFENAVNNSANSNTIKASDTDSIYSSILNITNTINRGASDKIIKASQVSPTKINIKVDLPVEKIMLLMQNTNGKVVSIKNVSTGTSLVSENYEVKYDDVANLSSTVAQIKDGSGAINRGSYEIEFDNPVDIKKISFLAEAYISAKIYIVDENDKILNDSQIKFLTSDKRIRVKCELLDGSGQYKIELSDMGVDFSNINVQLINDKNKYNMTYDSAQKAYYTELTLIGKNNNIYAIAEAKSVFRVKSNVIFIDTEANKMNVDKFDDEKIVFEVPYSSKKEYEEFAMFDFSRVDSADSNMAENFEILLVDFPKGIHVEYEGKEYDNGDSIPMINEVGKTFHLKLLSNKDYKEDNDWVSTLRIVTDALNTDIYWDGNGLSDLNVTFRPKMYRIDVIKKAPAGGIDVNEDTLDLSVIKIDEALNTVMGNVDVKDISKINTNSSFTSGYTYSVKKNDNNLPEVKFKPNIFALFNSNKLPIEIELELANGKEKAKYEETVELLNVDYLAILMPYIIGLILLILALGYVFKKKFNKKSQIAITENGEKVAYSLKPQLATLLIPYKAHKAKIGMIEFKAGKGNDLIYSAKGLDILKIDGENYEDYKETNNFNIEKMVMKRDFSSILINAFDVEQKYEYVTKDNDMSSYSTGSGDDYSNDGSYDDSYSDTYTDTYSDYNQF